MKIYLAARYSRRDELAAYACELALLGHDVTSRWLTDDHAVTDAELIDAGASLDALRLGQQYARRNIADVAACDLLIGFTEAVLPDLTRITGVERDRLRRAAEERFADPHAILEFSTHAPPWGGRHVEHGMAIAFGTPVWIVGPRENVFHTLADGYFTTWPGVVHALGLLAEGGLEPAQAGRWGWAAEGAKA